MGMSWSWTQIGPGPSDAARPSPADAARPRPICRCWGLRRSVDDGSLGLLPEPIQSACSCLVTFPGGDNIGDLLPLAATICSPPPDPWQPWTSGFAKLRSGRAKPRAGCDSSPRSRSTSQRLWSPSQSSSLSQVPNRAWVPSRPPLSVINYSLRPKRRNGNRPPFFCFGKWVLLF
jgi:hypothetical protein